MFCCSRYPTRIHVLKEGISYRMICRRACISGRHVLVLVISFMRVCVMGGHER